MIIIGICGASGSGKTSMAEALREKLQPYAVAVLSMDDYYYDCSTLSAEEKAKRNFNHPNSIDVALLYRHIMECKKGKAIHKPQYDHASCTRLRSTISIQLPDILIVEGLLLLYFPALRALLDLKIFIDSNPVLCRERVIARDMLERGKTREEVMMRLKTVVEPMYRRYVRPLLFFADIIISAKECLNKENIFRIAKKILTLKKNI